MSEITLNLEARTLSGKKVTQLRQQGIVPSVVYGGSADPINTQSGIVETTKISHRAGVHSPVNLVIDGKKHLAIIKNIDIDPVKHTVRHLAFHTINQNEVITTTAPIHLAGVGESPAERAGLIVLQAIEHVEIKAKPADLPESLELSLESLTTTEDKLTLADIKLPKGVEFADLDQDMDLVVANVYEPGALQAANEAAAGESESANAESVESEKGGDTEQDAQAGESMPGGKEQKEPKQSNVDANK